MLRLPVFGIDTPTTVAEAVSALARPGARLVAGGTDLLPNLKHRIETPDRLVSLAALPLRDVEEQEGALVLGACATLAEISENETVQRLFPSLAHAAGHAASPLIRNSGTLGGNVNLDTRCRYVNQTEFWRSAIGGCLKSEGEVCHVVPGGRKCVAALSSDTVPVLVGLEAILELVGPEGERTLPIADYYRGDGVRHTVRKDAELVTRVRVPIPEGPRRQAYRRWSVRNSIDFPLVSVAIRFDLAADDVDAVIEAARVVVGVLAAKPRVVGKLDSVVGLKLSNPVVAGTVSQRAFDQCHPVDNVPYEAAYRRQMLKVQTRRAIEELVAAG